MAGANDSVKSGAKKGTRMHQKLASHPGSIGPHTTISGRPLEPVYLAAPFVTTSKK